MNSNAATGGRGPAGIPTMAGGAAMAAMGVMQAVMLDDTNPKVQGREHLVLALFAVSLVLLIPGLLALARYGARAALAGAAAVSIGHVLLAFGATATNLHGEDYPWFGAVAVPANLAMLVGSIAMAVSLWRAGRVPRLIAGMLPLLWVCEIILSQLGGGLVVGVYWLAVGWLLASGALAGRAAAPADPARA
jgi:hypothetical protein